MPCHEIAGTVVQSRTDEIREMVALKQRGWIDPGLLKSHNLQFDDAQKAYDMYADHSDGVIKVAMKVS